MIKMIDKATAIGASRAVIARGVKDHTVETLLDSRAATKISAATVVLQGSIDDQVDDANDLITPAVLAIGTTAERFANGLFYFLVGGTSTSKAANVAGSVFSAAHVITASLWGAINIYINGAGSWLTLVPVSPQAYATAEAAHDAADAIATPPGYIKVGRILIANNAGDWTANTDDMTDASDVTTATFISYASSFQDLYTYPFIAGDITRGRAMFHVTDKTAQKVRVFLSALTGTGEITCFYHQNF